MKHNYLLAVRKIGIFLIVIAFSSCSRQSTVIVSGGTGTGNTLPPGQAKKVYGGAATDYAPGQKKKGGWH